jgi:type I restriction enzyme S subunit
MAGDGESAMKDTPAGPMPRDWELRRLGEFAKEVIARANANGARSLPLLSVTKHQGIVRAEDYFGRTLFDRDTANYKVVKPGQFAYATIHLDEGSIGCLTGDASGLVSPMYTVFELNREIDPSFLLELLKSRLYLQRYAAFSQGSVNRRASIPFSSLRALTIHFAPFAEQKSIASVLSAVEDAIQRTTVLISSLERAKICLMRAILTKGLSSVRNKLVPIVEPWLIGRIASSVDKMPSHWKLVTLTKVAKLESGHTPSRQHPEYWDGDIPWLSLGDTSELKKLRVEKTSECVTQAGIDNSSARLLPADTVVLSRTAVRGLCSRLAKPMATSQDFVAFVCGPEVLPAYLMQLFRHMQREWRRLEQGSSPTNKTLYFSVFKGLKILLPPPDEQAAIAEVGEALDARIAAEARYLEQLRHTRVGLAQVLLSGRVRVSAGKTNGAHTASAAARGL